MIEITAKGIADVDRMLAAFPKQASRALELSLDGTAREIKKDVQAEMRRVFDRPKPFTINSLKLTLTQNHNMLASVWFLEPKRMKQHYLVPQVEGGQRNLKGHEYAIGLGRLAPTKIGARLDAYGNVSTGQIRQMMSVFGKAEVSAGYMANMTARSARRNTKERDYVIIDRRQRGHLPLGVYQRFAQAGREIDAKTARKFGTRGSKAYQMGRSKGKWQSITRARGLRPVLLAVPPHQVVKPLLDFYGVANLTYERTFLPLFWRHLNRLVG